MPPGISFSARLDSIVAFTDALGFVGEDAHATRKMAQDLEDQLFKSSTSPEEYATRVDEWLRSQPGVESHASENDPSPDEGEILNREGPSFGAYQYATFHADGQMSTIFKAQARDPAALTRIVALKVTHPAMMAAPHDSAREARLLVDAAHDHVVPLLDAFRGTQGRFILVFPFLRQDLENLLRSGRLDARQQRLVFEGLFAALQHIHAVGLIHRDVKPANIMLQSMDGPVYLIDFGIAWSATDAASEPAGDKITDVGTTCYRPPELLFGDRAYDTSLDLWAAGCVVAEIIRPDHRPLFDAGPVGSELGLIKSIFSTLGTPDDETWPSAATCRDWGKMRFQPYPPQPWASILPGAGPSGVAFVRQTVCYESGNRLTATQALNHPLASDIGPGKATSPPPTALLRR